jgi:hypothetical protein
MAGFTCNCNTTTPDKCKMHDKPNFGEGWPEADKKLNRQQRRKLKRSK